MRSLKSGLFAIGFLGLFGTAAVVGCSASGAGTSGIEDTTGPTSPDPDPAPTGHSTLPPRNDGTATSDAGKDASLKDAASRPEAGVDAGPPPPVTGTPCTDITVTGKKPCGACGHAEALCQDDGTGNLKWTEYGPCGSQLRD